MIWPFSLPPPLYARRYLPLIIDRAYSEFKHVIRIQFTNYYERMDELEEDCMMNFSYYVLDRVLYDRYSCRWVSNGIGGTDEMFIVTNGDEQAMLMRMKWT